MSPHIPPKVKTFRFVINSLDTGGTENHLVRLLPRLAGSDFIPLVITLYRKGELAEALENAGIRVIQPPVPVRFLLAIPLLNVLLGIPAVCLYLVGTFILFPARLTCFYLPAAYILGSLAARVTGAGGSTIMFRRSLNIYQTRMFGVRTIERVLHRMQRAIAGNSQAVIRELQGEGVPENKLKLIYNGIELSHYSDKQDRELIRRELGLPQQAFVLVMVANLIPYKGHLDLIAALGLIRDRLPRPWVLLCAGGGIEKRPDLVSAVRRECLDEQVKWLGTRNDIGRIWAAADIGLQVSHQEGFSNAILEGMACGIPMIVTDVGGNSEAVEHGKTGLLVRPHDVQAIAGAILSLANEPGLVRAYGAAARDVVKNRFSMERCIENYKALFSAIAG